MAAFRRRPFVIEVGHASLLHPLVGGVTGRHGTDVFTQGCVQYARTLCFISYVHDCCLSDCDIGQTDITHTLQYLMHV